MQEMSYASWSAEVQDVKHRILSYHLFMEQSGPRVSIRPLFPRCLAPVDCGGVCLDQGMQKKN
jgi:hypothetical protein